MNDKCRCGADLDSEIARHLGLCPDCWGSHLEDAMATPDGVETVPWETPTTSVPVRGLKRVRRAGGLKR